MDYRFKDEDGTYRIAGDLPLVFTEVDGGDDLGWVGCNGFEPSFAIELPYAVSALEALAVELVDAVAEGRELAPDRIRIILEGADILEHTGELTYFGKSATGRHEP